MRNRTEEILYHQMIQANEVEISRVTIRLLDMLQQFKVHNQLLALGSALVCLLEVYGLKASDILGIAHNIVNQQSNVNVAKNFAGIKKYMRNEWAITKEW